MSSDLLMVLAGVLLCGGMVLAVVLAYSKQSGKRRAALHGQTSASRNPDAHH